MSRFLKAVALALAVAVGLPPAADIAHAAQTAADAELAKRRINMAGRQRMLSQRAARQICAAQAGIDPVASRAAALQTVETFESVLHALRKGGVDGLRPETDQTTADLLTEVVWLWQPYGTAIRNLSAGAPGGKLARVRELNTGVLRTMNSAVQAMEAAMGGGAVSSELARAINVAGRQRMLIERGMMWACMQTVNDQPAEDAAEIRKTIDLFAQSLQDLRFGNETAGLIAPPAWEIEAQLELVAGLWAEIAPDLEGAAEGRVIGADALGLLMVRGEALVEMMNEAVWMYETF